MIQQLSARFDLVPAYLFGNLVRSARLERNLSQRQLAQRVGKSPSYINYVESGANPSSRSGKFQPSVDIVDKIARILGLNLDEARLSAGYAPLHGYLGGSGDILEGMDELSSDRLELAKRQIKAIVRSLLDDQKAAESRKQVLNGNVEPIPQDKIVRVPRVELTDETRVRKPIKRKMVK